MKLNQLLPITAIPPVLFGILAFISINTMNVDSPSSLTIFFTIARNQPIQGQQRPPKPPRRDLKAAAAELEVTEQQLKDSLGVPDNPPELSKGRRPPRPDLKAAAAELGVPEQQLKDALGVPENPPERT
ncbi:MAG: hypothetical protein AAGF26_10605 [Cyanobacteria bacterium P01_G01_bin.49]